MKLIVRTAGIYIKHNGQKFTVKGKKQHLISFVGSSCAGTGKGTGSGTLVGTGMWEIKKTCGFLSLLKMISRSMLLLNYHEI